MLTFSVRWLGANAENKCSVGCRVPLLDRESKTSKHVFGGGILRDVRWRASHLTPETRDLTPSGDDPLHLDPPIAYNAAILWSRHEKWWSSLGKKNSSAPIIFTISQEFAWDECCEWQIIDYRKGVGIFSAMRHQNTFNILLIANSFPFQKNCVLLRI